MIPLVLSVLCCAAPSSGAVAPAPIAATAGDFEALTAEYEKAVAEWREALSAAESAARRELRAQHPAKAFWPRFEASASAGEGRALLWMVQHLRDAGVSLKERAAKEKPLLEALVNDHRGADWFGQALVLIDKRAGRDPAYLRLLERAATDNPSHTNTAQAAFLCGKRLWASASEAEKQHGKELLTRVQEEFGDTEYGPEATYLLAAANLEVGAVAPDFTGKTIDGHEFKLSDYRGKVVLVDFYGFW